MKSLQDTVLFFILKNLRSITGLLDRNINILPPTISEIILENLDNNNYGIPEEDLRYFKSDRLCLHKIVLNGHRITDKNNLNFLKDHPLKCLKIYCLNSVRIIEWINFINQKYLEELTIADDNFINNESDFLSGIKYLHCYETLEKLDFSYTNFDEECLNVLCNKFQLIKELKLVNTQVKNLNGLKNLKYLEILFFVDRKKIIDHRQLKNIVSLNNLIEFYVYFESLSTINTAHHRWVKSWLDEINWNNLEVFVFSFCKYFDKRSLRFVEREN